MAQGLNHAPVDLTSANDLIPKYQLGTFFVDEETGKAYKYVQVTVVTNTAVAKRPVYYESVSAGTTKTRQGTAKICAGVLLNTVTTAYHAWIQTKGEASVFVADSTAADTELSGHATNGYLAEHTGELRACGYTTAAAAADASTTGATIILDCPL